eukprot:3712890-Ditylum_brightwellii.AAC.1
MEQSEFVVVTDGSVGEINMFFGWKICTSNGEIIVEHVGHPFEPKAMVFISTQLFLLCNGVYGIDKAIERPT